ncbi:hypothetical protein D3C76_1523430 [compost metagenome]
MFIAEHATLVGFQADALQTQALGVRATANGDQYVVCFEAFAGPTCGRFQAQADGLC